MMRNEPVRLTDYMRRNWPEWLAVSLLLIAFIPLALPYLAPGLQLAHDREVPFMRVAALGDALRHQGFPPRWFPGFDGGYGSPYPSFYAMGFYYVSLLASGAGLSIGSAVELVAFLMMAGSAFAMFALARRLWGPLAGAVAGVLYAYAPYHLTDAFIRGAYSELAAFLWFPLIALSVLGILYRWQGPWLVLGPVSVFGLLISHNIMSMLFLPPMLLLAAVVGVLEIRDRSTTQAVQATWILLVGALLASVIWLPILFERGFIRTDYFLQFDYKGDFVGVRELLGLIHLDSFPTQVGWPHVVLAAVSAVGLLRARRGYSHAPLVAGSGLIAVGLLYLANFRSQWIWELIPILQFTQFPWRLLAPASFFLCLAAASPFASPMNRTITAPAAAIVVLLTIVLYSPLAEIDDRIRKAPVSRSAICQEVWGTQDYRPAWSEAAFWRGTEPPAEAAAVVLPACPEGPSISSGQFSAGGATTLMGHDLELDLHYNSERSATITVPQFYYPGWAAEIDGVEVEAQAEARTGLLQINAPAGRHQLSIRYRGTSAQRLGTVLFVVGLILLVGGPWLKDRLLASAPEGARGMERSR